MNRRTFIGSIAGSLLAAPLVSRGQQARKVPVIGYLIERSGPTAFDEAFRLGLRELGYTEGGNVVIEYRWADGKTERLPPLAAELVRLKVDVIVTSGTPGGLAAKNATSTIPIVMASGGDFVSDGLVASYSRPGGNITGLSVFARELSGKRLEILKEAIPGMTRVAAAFNTLNPGTRSLFKETEAAATKLGLTALPLNIQFPDGVEPAFAEAVRLRASGVVIISDGATIVHRAELGSAALKHHMPTIFANKTYLEGGGLMSYGPDIIAVWRRAATYVDKVLKGAKPADMPIEQPAKFELVINLRTAAALGLALPPALLQRADELIQ
jgi:putative tryptophan/tyrosine transport system substrate-binding protein